MRRLQSHPQKCGGHNRDENVFLGQPAQRGDSAGPAKTEAEATKEEVTRDVDQYNVPSAVAAKSPSRVKCGGAPKWALKQPSGALWAGQAEADPIAILLWQNCMYEEDSQRR